MRDSEKYRKYKAEDKYYNSCIEEKLPIASYYNPSELLNQKSEMIFVHIRKVGCSVGNVCFYANYILSVGLLFNKMWGFF